MWKLNHGNDILEVQFTALLRYKSPESVVKESIFSAIILVMGLILMPVGFLGG